MSGVRLVARVKPPVTLVELHRRIMTECERATLSADLSQNFVAGVGNLEADVMFVGEAPGHCEDAAGVPFIGPSGRLLDSLLASIHLKRANVYITNIVKRRPPANRDPWPQEVAAALPYLQREVALVKPIVVATLGKFAMRALLPDVHMGIMKAHGVPITKDHLTIFPMYHPAVALYNDKMKGVLVEDMRRLDELLTERG